MTAHRFLRRDVPSDIGALGTVRKLVPTLDEPISALHGIGAHVSLCGDLRARTSAVTARCFGCERWVACLGFLGIVRCMRADGVEFTAGGI